MQEKILSFRERTSHHFAVIDILGEVKKPHGFHQLDQEFGKFLTSEKYHIALNFSQCIYMDTDGIGSLVRLRQQIQGKGQIVILEPSAQARHIIMLSGLDKILDIYESEKTFVQELNHLSKP